MRRPSGDVSWMCRIQNSSLVSDSHGEFPLADLTALFQPTKADNELHAGMLDASKRIPIDSLTEKEYEALWFITKGLNLPKMFEYVMNNLCRLEYKPIQDQTGRAIDKGQ